MSSSRDWNIFPDQRMLRVQGKPVQIGGRAFDVLLALVQRQGQVVRKSELLEVAWKGLFVEENNLTVQISALRKCLGQDTIKTVAGVGYVLAAAPGDPPPAAPTRAQPPAFEHRLFGRDDDVETLVERVGALPLVTIVGTGGVGKTSLAKNLLQLRASRWGDQVHWIDLAPIGEGRLVVPLIAKAIGIEVDEHRELVAAFDNLQVVIALDNCEHVLDDVAGFVSEVLQRAPGVRWLATSQEPFHLPGEAVYRLQPLETPAAGATLDEALACGAIILLCERARTADWNFALDERTLETAIDLCRQLDGLPLAIEMAAARIATLGLRGVHRQLGQRLQLLAGPRSAPPRHHSLRSLFDWSYGLLDPLEQKVFVYLHAFADGFDLALATLMLRDLDAKPRGKRDDEVIAAISGLVDKSLVQRSGDRDERFFLYESAREYGRQRAIEGAALDDVLRRHAEAVATFFDTARHDADRMRDEEWVGRYLPERHNVAGALRWACGSTDADLLARCVAAMAQVDLFIRVPAEVVRFEIPIDVLLRASTPLRAIACLDLSWAHLTDGSLKTGTELALAALADFRFVEDAAGAYRALAQLARLYESRPGMADEAHRAQQMLEAADDCDLPLRTRLFCNITAGLQHDGRRTIDNFLAWQEMASAAGFDSLAALCSVHVVDELLIARRFDEAARIARDFVDAGIRRPRLNGTMLINQVLALVQLGRFREAFVPAQRTLQVLPGRAHLVIGILALGAAREGRLAEAAMASGYCAKVRRDRDEHPDPAEAEADDETASCLLNALGSERVQELTKLGAAMQAPDVLALLFGGAGSAPRGNGQQFP